MAANKALTETKHRLRMEIKEISAAGEFEGLLSVYNNVDQGRDLVEPGAFTKTIKERGSEVPLLWQHRPDTPIGMLALEDGPDALRVKGRLLMELPEAQKAYLLMKARIVKGLSIGFETIKDSVTDGVRHLKELRLFEGSVVTFPMNELATVTSVKAADGTGPDDFNEELTEIQLFAASCQLLSALDNALSGVRWSMLSKDEQVTASQAIIEQFSEAYMAYLPAYIDMLAKMYGGMELSARKQLELKAGRAHSAATRDQYKAMKTHAKSLDDILTALLDEEAGESTSDPEAAESKTSEPDSHSAAKTLELIDSLRSLIPAA